MVQRVDDFTGKSAVVTGGSQGIGLAAARRLAQGGASVVICSPNERDEQVAAELRAAGLIADFKRADVRHAEDMRELMDFAASRHGGIDILANCAGVQRYGDVTQTPEEVWDEVLGVNLKGIYLASQYAIPEMRKRGGGAIVNISSVQAYASQKGVAAYTASKGGINALTRAMALDHASDNIRVNVVCPASVDTPMLRGSADLFKGEGTQQQTLDSWGKMHPLGRVAKGEEVAELIAFLASDKAAFITGGDYKIDGGMLAALGVHLPE
ncbi:SDR family NAD(P)-dependent oxidoreductase [Cohnella yongneupensis]|uniref:SDR family NAD(P)-dependent oxidoreductase n=1 Tax=Cohnella yongneupensis TaxID=425006 RepID=A0ABW0R1X0_9BACL